MSSGDTLSLAEHHIYGSSRLGVQRYDSVSVANIIHLPEEHALDTRSSLRVRVPWYSYSFADLIDSTKKTTVAPGLHANSYIGTLEGDHTVGKRYYELTDHLGNVLATVLDRKTGYKTSPGATMYDHWSADLASVSDYYPGGMMMPGRNLEWDWSRHGFNGQMKTDEVYGRGNLNTAKFWEMDTRIIRRWNLDPVDQISVSNYAVNSLNPIWFSDPLGDKDDKDVKNNPNAPSRRGGTERFHKERIASAKEVKILPSDKGGSVSAVLSSANASASTADANGEFKGPINAVGDIKAEAGTASAEYTPSNVVGISAKAKASVLSVATKGAVSSSSGNLSLLGSAEGDWLSAGAGISTPGAKGPYVEGEVGAYTVKGEASGGFNVFGFRVKGTIGGSAGSAHIGGGFGVYFDKQGVTLKVFEHVGLGVGEKPGLSITVPLGAESQIPVQKNKRCSI